MIRAVLYAFLVLPAVPIALGWRRVVRLRALGERVNPLAPGILALVTCSQGLLMAGLISADVVGPDYSERRYATILVNLGVMAVATVLAAIAGGRLRGPLVASCAWVTCSWLYLCAVSSVV